MTDEEKKQAVKGMYEGHRLKHFPEINEITTSDLLKADPTGIMLVDCRSEEERAVSTIANSVPLTVVEEKLQNGDEDVKNISQFVFFCTIGYRSGMAAKKVSEQFNLKDKCYNLVGSLLLYLHEGGKVVDANQQPTEKVHVYGTTWDLVPQQYVSKTF